AASASAAPIWTPTSSGIRRARCAWWRGPACWSTTSGSPRAWGWPSRSCRTPAPARSSRLCRCARGARPSSTAAATCRARGTRWAATWASPGECAATTTTSTAISCRDGWGGCRAPSPTGDVIGNPTLLPQYVHTFEFQAAWAPTGWLDLSSDVAYSLVDDKTEFLQQGINKVARNVAHATTLSWESLVEARATEWLQAHLSFEWQRTRQRTGQEGFSAQVVGEEGTIYPKIMLHGGLVVRSARARLRAAVQASYIGEPARTTSSSAAAPTPCPTTCSSRPSWPPTASTSSTTPPRRSPSPSAARTSSAPAAPRRGSREWTTRWPRGRCSSKPTSPSSPVD